MPHQSHVYKKKKKKEIQYLVQVIESLSGKAGELALCIHDEIHVKKLKYHQPTPFFHMYLFSFIVTIIQHLKYLGSYTYPTHFEK